MNDHRKSRAILQTAKILACAGTMQGLEPSLEMLQALPEHEHLTGKIFILAEVAGNLHRIIASLITDGLADKVQNEKDPATKVHMACEALQKTSPELMLLCALWCHFHVKDDDEQPYLSAARMLKTLGHVIPEKLIEGLEEVTTL